MMSEQNMHAKVVLITGASGGIGRGTAIQFAKHGARLAITGRNEENLRKTAELCKAEGLKDEDLFLITGELSKEEDVNKIVDGTVQNLGGIDSLVNNAGLSGHSNFDNTTVEDFDHMYHNNLRSVFMVTKRAVPHLIKRKGTVVNVSSLAGMVPTTGQYSLFPYGVFKAALNHMSTIMAAELAEKGVRVNCISPGMTKTDIFKRKGGFIEGRPDLEEQLYSHAERLIPLHRVAQPEEVGQLILFLASDASVNITGVNIPIDGGHHFTIRE